MPWEYAIVRTSGKSTWLCKGKDGTRVKLAVNADDHQAWTAYLHEVEEKGWELVSSSASAVFWFLSPSVSREYVFRRPAE